MRRLIGVVVAAIAVAACSGDADDDAGSTTSTTRENTTSTTAASASVEQYASIVAQHQAELLDGIAVAEECLGLYEAPCSIRSALSVSTVGLKANTLAIELDAGDSDTPENRLYIGDVPDELTGLVERTIDAAEASEAGGQAFLDDGCGAQPGADVTPANTCDDTALDAWLANNELKDALLAWEPYL